MSEQIPSNPILVTYDPLVDAAYIYLKGHVSPGEAVRQKLCGPHIVLDFDKGGFLIGIELLRGDLLHPNLRRIAKRLEPLELPS
jgi:uncharacterized protein YuzE